MRLPELAGTLKNDGRFQVNPEWCGYPEQRYVFRFCGQYIMQAKTKQCAWLAAARYQAKRQGIYYPS